MSQSRPEILMRADAGSKIGFGHVVRSAALASLLRDDFDCWMVCHNDNVSSEPFVDNLIASSGARRILTSDYLQPFQLSVDEANAEFFSAVTKERIVVLDNYYYDSVYQRQVRGRCRALVSIDDMSDREFVSDVFFTPSPLLMSELNLAPYTEFYGGIEWTFLREPFLQPVKRKRRERIDSVLVSMGGADPLRLSDIFIEIVRGLKPEARIDVIAGPAAIINSSPDDKLDIHRNVDAVELVELIDSADFGIFPASTSSIEALARKLPIAAGWYADNQYRYYRHGVERSLFYDLGELTLHPNDIEQKLKNIFENPGQWLVPEFNFGLQREKIIKIFKELWKKSRERQ